MALDRRATTSVSRLAWAGIRIETDDAALFVDPWEGTRFFGQPLVRRPIPAVSERRQRVVALTHLHCDHCDRPVLRRLIASPGVQGTVHVLDRMAAELAGPDLPLATHVLWEPRTTGPFTLVPVPAVDGWGDCQVAWVIMVGGFRAFHGGDGLWHGRWWDYGRSYGPFDVAFLPINGASTPGDDPPVRVARTMAPVEAAEAAVALGARLIVPIHFGLSLPGIYEETPSARALFDDACRVRGLRVHWVEEGGAIAP